MVDRPTQGHRFLSRKYLQPQWVLDSANFRVLMPAELYVPGRVPPPHLSPFVNDDEEGYTPDFAATVKRLQVRGGQGRICILAGGAEMVGIDPPSGIGHAASLCGSTNESLLGRVTFLRWACRRPDQWPAITPMGVYILSFITIILYNCIIMCEYPIG